MVESDIVQKHFLVPKHEVLSKTASDKFMKDNNVTKDQLPRLHAEDPAAKAISAKKGDIIKITRDSITAGEAVYYRLVV